MIPRTRDWWTEEGKLGLSGFKQMEEITSGSIKLPGWAAGSQQLCWWHLDALRRLWSTFESHSVFYQRGMCASQRGMCASQRGMCASQRGLHVSQRGFACLPERPCMTPREACMSTREACVPPRETLEPPRTLSLPYKHIYLPESD